MKCLISRQFHSLPLLKLLFVIFVHLFLLKMLYLSIVCVCVCMDLCIMIDMIQAKGGG